MDFDPSVTKILSLSGCVEIAQSLVSCMLSSDCVVFKVPILRGKRRKRKLSGCVPRFSHFCNFSLFLGNTCLNQMFIKILFYLMQGAGCAEVCHGSLFQLGGREVGRSGGSGDFCVKEAALSRYGLESSPDSVPRRSALL